MKKVVVGSQNPVKLQATQEAFFRIFPDEQFEYVCYEAVSGVPDQPMGDKETKEGATNRAEDCRTHHPEADFFVGLEGGLEEIEGEFWAMAWMCVIATSGKAGHGKTSSFLLPPKVSELIHEGKELGVASDIVFNEVNSKHAGGTVGILTNGLITRKEFYREAMMFALIPFLQPTLYQE